MFYLVRNLKTCLIFSPHDLDKLNTLKTIVQMLRQKMEGLCFNELGYIVKVIKDRSQYSDPAAWAALTPEEKDEEIKKDKIDGRIREFLVSTPETDENGIKIFVTFTAICFKAQKNDLVQFRVATVGEQSIIGYIGPVQVVAPRIKIQGFEYKKDENILISRLGSEDKIVKIDRGTRIKAKCISSHIEMNDKMKIVVEIPKELVFLIENDYK